MHFSFSALRQCLLVAAFTACASVLMTQASLASIIVYTATLNGASEAPANGSPGTGLATVTVDDVARTMRVQVTFSGLTGTTSNAHIHAATAVAFTGTSGVATTLPSFAGFPLGVTAGSMDNTYDMSLATSFNAAYVTANGGTTTTATTALFDAMAQGKAYFNIHTSTFGGGEIRGFLVTAVPEPSSMVLSGLAIAGLAFGYRRRRMSKSRLSSDETMTN